MKILMIDNYDSFTYNLVQFIEKFIGQKIDVFRNDKITVDEAANYDKIVISPGPGIPDEAGITKELIEKLGPKKSIFGVCLGHQAIGEVFGAELINMNNVFHGVPGIVNVVKEDYLFKSLPTSFEGGRYHSWLVASNLPDSLELLAENSEGQVMAIKHKEYDIRGVQFHPESVLTPEGGKIIHNWLFEKR
jgi:anthranilate synthase component 2